MIIHILGSVQPDEIPGFLLFIGMLAAVYLTAAAMLVEFVLHWRKGLLPRATIRQKLVRGAIFGTAFAGLLCMLYGYAVEPYWLEITHVSVQSTKLAPESGPVRIVQISDLHCDPEPRLEISIPQSVKNQKPDLIVFTGDAINTPAGLPLFRDCLKRLAVIAPTYVVKGNWDSLYWKDLNLFGGTGAIELNGDCKELEVRGTRLWIGGAPIGGAEVKLRALSSVPRQAFSIFLYHYPSGVIEAAEKQVDLVLAGHTHGGQVALPGYGAIITLSRLGKKFEAGLYRLKQSWLYVNRGIGMEGGQAPRVRFCARPEITVFELSSAASPR